MGLLAVPDDQSYRVYYYRVETASRGWLPGVRLRASEFCVGRMKGSGLEVGAVDMVRRLIEEWVSFTILRVHLYTIVS